MKLELNIDYRTRWGETLYVTGNIAALGNGDETKAAKMTLEGYERWKLTLDLPEKTRRFDYRYIVKNDNGQILREWGKDHTLFVAPDVREARVYDRWQERAWDVPFYSSAFVDCISRHDHRDEPAVAQAGTLTMRAWAPMLGQDESLGIAGNIEAFGKWDENKAVKMNNSAFPEWSASFGLDAIETPLEYKFVIIDNATGKIKAWESGENRRLNERPGEGDDCVVMSGFKFMNPRELWRGAGVAIPVFSLRSEEDFGVGDFIDLKSMVDWAVATGQKFIQVLPINDTTMTHTWTDSYPYNANSTFALHPMYLRLEKMGILDDPERREYYEGLRMELGLLDKVDYERVNNAKTAYSKEIFAQNGKETLESDEFKSFVERNSDWLLPYAAFCVLRDRFNSPDCNDWGEYAVYDSEKVAQMSKENEEAISFVYYQQYHLDKQLREVSEYARQHGVALKGDIPIGISRTSVDAWLSPRLFNLDCQAGAPPDDFSVLGQNWGFPTYNWEEMSKDGFAWWKARFKKMAEYFDAYRIDHVLGFFRIWQIPMEAVHGLLGIFNPALPYTAEEMRSNYDFHINPEVQTKPYIMEDMLHDFFGEFTDDAKREYLDYKGDGRYELKEQFDTQRKVADYFKVLDATPKTERLCNGLLWLIDQVLFIEDPVEKGKYHPRISAQFTYIYRSLNDYEKWCFDRLYDDFFYHRHNDFWYGKAMWKLPPLIDATKMLVCAEDLGMIPDCVPAVMEKLEMIALEIQRMPKIPGEEFGDTWHYPYYSVCTTSTHDMGGIRMWWEENREKTQHYFNNVLHESGAAPYNAEPWICDRIIDLHLESPSMLCILPLQDWLSTDAKLRRDNPFEELINIPANPRHYWRYRMHLPVERLLEAHDFNTRMKERINKSRR